LLLFVPFAGRADDPKPAALRVRLSGETDGTFEVSGFAPATAKRLADKDFAAKLAEVFTVTVDGKKDVPPLLGEYKVNEQSLTFKPRFPLQRGVRYRAVVHPDKLPAADEKYAAAEETFLLPKPKVAPTVVEHVYPSADRLPENLLRFYFHFSAPMHRGEVYKQIRMIDAAGKPV
jgi:hypothetical protein